MVIAGWDTVASVEWWWWWWWCGSGGGVAEGAVSG